MSIDLKVPQKKQFKAAVFDGFSIAYLAFILWSWFFSHQSLPLTSACFFFCLLCGLGCGLSFILRRWEFQTLGHKVFIAKQNYDSTQSSQSSLWAWHLIFLLAFTLIKGALVTQFSIYDLFDEDGFNGASRLFYGLASPAWSLLPEAVSKIIETVFMAFMATFIAIPFAFVLSFLSAKNVMTHPAAYIVYFLLRTFLNLVRSVEALIWAIIFSVWVGIGPFAGMLALMIHSMASLAKQYSEMIESVEQGPIEGIKSTGANVMQVIWFGIVPQVLLPYISFTVYRWDINVRMATIIGLVGGGGIGTLLIKFQGQAMWNEVGCIVVVIAIVVWLMDQASAHIREALK